jgi:hypothetical protein
MRQISVRRIAVGAAALVVAGAVGAPALAQHGHSFAPRAGGLHGGFGVFGIRGGFGPGLGGFGPGLGGFGLGHLGPGGRGGGVLGLDVLTPAASFLNMSVTDLANDLKSGKSLADEAKAKGKTAADLISAVVAAEKKVLDAEVSAGWITSAQETSLVSSLTNAITDLVNNGPPVPPSGLGTHQSLLDLASSFLGISVSDLQADLKAGKTLADEAKAKGKSVSDLVNALVAPTKTDLDSRVKDGTITQAQETAILNRLTTRLTDVVNGTTFAHSTASLRDMLGRFGLRMAQLHR